MSDKLDESLYRRSLESIANGTNDLWGLDKLTSICIDFGSALTINPREDGSAILTITNYSWLDDHERGEQDGTIDVAVLQPEPYQICFSRLKKHDHEEAMRRDISAMRAANAVGYLANQSSAF